MEQGAVYERIIHSDPIKHTQIRLTISEFKGIEYLHVRKYYLDFEEEWKPSSEGVSMPLDIDNAKELLIALLEILSLAESKQLIEEHFSEIINKIYEY